VGRDSERVTTPKLLLSRAALTHVSGCMDGSLGGAGSSGNLKGSISYSLGVDSSRLLASELSIVRELPEPGGGGVFDELGNAV